MNDGKGIFSCRKVELLPFFQADSCLLAERGSVLKLLILRMPERMIPIVTQTAVVVGIGILILLAVLLVKLGGPDKS